MPRQFSTNLITNEIIQTLPQEKVLELAELGTKLQLGLSSAGLLRYAALGLAPQDYDGYRPADDDDLGRCERAYAAAPPWLQSNMLDLLNFFRTEVAAHSHLHAEQTKRIAAEDAAQAATAREELVTAELQHCTIIFSLAPTEKKILAEILETSVDQMVDSLFTTDEESEVCRLGATREEFDAVIARFWSKIQA